MGDVKTTKEELKQLIEQISFNGSTKIARLRELLAAEREENHRLIEEIIANRSQEEQEANAELNVLKAKFESLDAAYEKVCRELFEREQECLLLRGRIMRDQNKMPSVATQTMAPPDRTNANDNSMSSGPTCAKKAKLVDVGQQQQQDVKFASTSSLGPINSFPSNVGPMEQMHFQLEKMCGEVTKKALHGLEAALLKLIANSDVAAAAFNTENLDISHESNSSKDEADSGVHDGKEEEEDNEDEAMDMMDVREASQNAMQGVGQYLGGHQAEEANASLGSTVATAFINYFRQYCFTGVTVGEMTAEMAVDNFLLHSPINYVEIAANDYVEMVKKQMAAAARVFVEAAKRNAEKNA